MKSTGIETVVDGITYQEWEYWDCYRGWVYILIEVWS